LRHIKIGSSRKVLGKAQSTKIVIFQHHRISTDLEYKFNDKWYTEEDMLRIVNLTPFM